MSEQVKPTRLEAAVGALNRAGLGGLGTPKWSLQVADHLVTMLARNHVEGLEPFRPSELRRAILMMVSPEILDAIAAHLDTIVALILEHVGERLIPYGAAIAERRPGDATRLSLIATGKHEIDVWARATASAVIAEIGPPVNNIDCLDMAQLRASVMKLIPANYLKLAGGPLDPYVAMIIDHVRDTLADQGHRMLVSEFADGDGMVRVEGSCPCPDCGLPYWRHPHDRRLNQLSYDGQAFLRLACDGRALKL